MKKWLSALVMTICLLGLTACGTDEVTAKYMSDSDALGVATSICDMLEEVVSTGQDEMYIAQAEYSGEDGNMYRSAFESFEKAQPDIGEILSVGELLKNDVEMNILDIPEAGTIEAEIIGSEHDAVLQIIVKKGQISSIAVNVSYSFGENMKKAGLNTLLGMGTVFVVLILICLIISAFGIIPKIQAASAKKKEAAKTPAASTVDQTIAQIVEKEELADDTELVAVIAAAIASYEGTSADGFVVRSIRRAR